MEALIAISGLLAAVGFGAVGLGYARSHAPGANGLTPAQTNTVDTAAQSVGAAIGSVISSGGEAAGGKLFTPPPPVVAPPALSPTLTPGIGPGGAVVKTGGPGASTSTPGSSGAAVGIGTLSFQGNTVANYMQAGLSLDEAIADINAEVPIDEIAGPSGYHTAPSA